MYDRLFRVENPADEEGDFKEYLNPDSLQTITAFIEPALTEVPAGQAFQALRKGYFCADTTSTPDKPVFNRTVGLKDAWAKEIKKA